MSQFWVCSCVWHGWVIHRYDVTVSYVRHGRFIHMYDMTHSCSQSSHMSSECIHMCDTADMIHSYSESSRTTNATENSAHPKSTKSSNSNSSVQIQNQNLNLNLYGEIPRNLSFSISWISGVQHFQWKLSVWALDASVSHIYIFSGNYRKAYQCIQSSPCHTYQYIQNSYDCFQNMNESCHTYQCIQSSQCHTYQCFQSFACELWMH